MAVNWIEYVLCILNVWLITVSAHSTAAPVVNNYNIAVNCAGNKTEDQELLVDITKDLNLIKEEIVGIKDDHDMLKEDHDMLKEAIVEMNDILKNLSRSGNEDPGSPPKDCHEVQLRGHTSSGIYTIQPSLYPEPFTVYCDLETDGGGWTVFQRRMDGTVEFYRNWADYKRGFGNQNKEFWIGNEKLFYLTAQDDYELRVDLSDFDGNSRFAQYSNFRIGDEKKFYVLSVGGYSGNAGDSLTYNNLKSFTTYDADHDTNSNNCASRHKGAWWHGRCGYANLNGLYLEGADSTYTGVFWAHWLGYGYSLKRVDMKIRPVNR